MEWVSRVVERHRLWGGPTLEVGSRNVNGSVRQLFRGEYLGIDREAGAGVDLVADIETEPLTVWNGTWRTVVSTEMLEHTLRPELALRNMARAARLDGALILTCRGYDRRGAWEPHDAPDYWRFSAGALTELLGALWQDVEVTADPEGPGWFCLGQGRLSGAVWAEAATVAASGTG